MSAQAVLSMIAPTLPAAPQGPSDTGASGLEGLFAALLAAEGAMPAVADGAAIPAGGEAPAGTDGPPTEGADLSLAPGLLTTVIPLTVPLTASPVVPTGVEPPAAGGSAEPVATAVATPTSGPSTSPTPSPPMAPISPPAAQALPEAAPQASEPQAQPAATAKAAERQGLAAAPTAKAIDPQILPVAVAADEASLLPSGENSMDITLSEEESATAPVKPPAVPSQSPPPPPPLRALAERTSKPLNPDTQTSNFSAPTEAKAGAQTPSAPPSLAEQPGKPASPVAAAQAAPAAADTAPASAESAPAGEPVSAQAEAAGPAREHGLSTLSRATIDATAQIAAQILRKLEGRSTRFEIALRPDELGRVDVKLDIDAEGRLAARLAFDNPVAATDLRGRVDDLRRQLEAAGFQLADDAFEFTERDSGSSAFDRGQDSRHGQSRAFAAAARLNADIDMAQPPQWLALSLSPSGVDMKV
jgi:flagellar hook-length control protein FliK